MLWLHLESMIIWAVEKTKSEDNRFPPSITTMIIWSNSKQIGHSYRSTKKEFQLKSECSSEHGTLFMILMRKRMEIQLFCFGFPARKVFNCFPFFRMNLTLIICLSSLFMVLISFSFSCTIRLTILQTHVNSFLRLPFGWLTLSKCARNIESNQFRAIQALVSDRAKLSRMICRMRNLKISLAIRANNCRTFAMKLENNLAND